MERVIQLTTELAQAVCNSDIYNAYIQSKTVIESNERLKNEIDNYRRKQIEYSMRRETTYVSDEDKLLLSSEFSNLFVNPEALEFFKCEREMINMLSAIIEGISSGVNIELGFMDT